jgi:hypothetical protein
LPGAESSRSAVWASSSAWYSAPPSPDVAQRRRDPLACPDGRPRRVAPNSPGPGKLTDIACAGHSGYLHVCGRTEVGGLWHTIRRPEGWVPFLNVRGTVGFAKPFDRIAVAA